MSKTAKLALTFLLTSAFLIIQGDISLKVVAQSCTGYQCWPIECEVSASGDCVNKPGTTACSGCVLEGSSCVSHPKNYICGFDAAGTCDVRGDGRVQTVACGGGGGGGGGGTCSTCPAGQVPTSYNPPQYFCPNPGSCTTINRETGEVCGTTINGNDKIRVERRYCAPAPTPVVCNPLYFCQTTDYTCAATSSTYNSAQLMCPALVSSCASNLQVYAPGQTTGICYASLSTCNANCNAPSTPPPPCTTGAWTNTTCGGGSCSNNQMQQTRTVSPAGCAANTRCVANSACTTTTTPGPSPTPVPGCVINSAAFSGGNLTFPVGASRTLTMTVNDNPNGCATSVNFVRSNANIQITSVNPDNSEPFAVTISCNSAGNSTITGRARIGSTVHASDSREITCTAVTVTPTPTPRPTNTPTPTTVPGCSVPRPRDPPAVACGNPATVTWEWNDVANVNQYNLVIQRQSGSSWSNVEDFGWRNASFFNCQGDGVGVCRHTETRPNGTYRSRIRARNTNAAVCTTSAFDNSQAVDLRPCATINLPDITINGAPESQTSIVSTSNLPPSALMTFNVADTSVATVVPQTDLPAYQTTVTSQSIGTTTYTATANDFYGNPVSDTASITVINPQPWCQAKEGDVIGGGISPNGNISCPIPPSCEEDSSCEPSLITADAGDVPGVVVAGGSVNNGSGQSSRDPYNWTVSNTRYEGTRYDFEFFDEKSSSMNFGIVPASVNNSSALTGLPSSSGYRWGRRNGNLTINANINIGSEKVILLVDGNVDINRSINLTNGRGFLLLVASGNINVAPSVGGSADTTPDLKGIYFADGTFASGTTGSGDSQLHVRGTVVAGDFELERDLSNNAATPAELFEFAPDQYMQFPGLFARQSVVWREVAP